MSKSYAAIIQNLCRDYMGRKISFDEYRRRRQIVLYKIDVQFNGADGASPDTSAPETTTDVAAEPSRLTGVWRKSQH